MHELIERMFLTAFANPALLQRHDAAFVSMPSGQLVLTTDAYVVRPLFFPGGDIGSLAVHGTVNDLAMSTARPLYLTASFILEEGLPMESLWRIVQSMKRACEQCGVQIVTGDTKVVDKGKGDGVFITTAGVGVLSPEQKGVGPDFVQPTDVVIVSGDLGRHGIAIMAVREGLEFESLIESDSASLWSPVEKLLQAGIEMHCLRDLTRGGLVSALNEISMASGLSIEVTEKAIPVREDVRGACEILGLDPLSVANEGRFMAVVAAKDADRALKILQGDPVSAQSAVIGRVFHSDSPQVTMRGRIGALRILDMLSGEQLPRIC